MTERMNTIRQNINAIVGHLPQQVRLVAVSKYHSIEKIREAYDAGQRLFGESRANELKEKAMLMPVDTEWHFIGHLQTNKVKTVVPLVTMIHSVDSFALIKEIDRQTERFVDERSTRGLPTQIKVLLQLRVAKEPTKFGFTYEELCRLLDEGLWKECRHVEMAGLMCIGTNTDDREEIRREFLFAKICFDEIRQKYFPYDESFCECSWGMTDDYPIALVNGSTLVRIGSGIFGEREY